MEAVESCCVAVPSNVRKDAVRIQGGGGTLTEEECGRVVICFEGALKLCVLFGLMSESLLMSLSQLAVKPLAKQMINR